jgi:hypothetical protein
MRKLSKIATGHRGRNGADRHQIRRGDGRGRDEDFSSPPAQIPARAANAPGSSLGSDVVAMSDLGSLVVRRAAIIRIDAAFRLTVRAAAA